METSVLFRYIITQLDSVLSLERAVASISLICIIFCFLRWVMLYDNLTSGYRYNRVAAYATVRQLRRWIRTFIYILIVCAAIEAFVPTSQGALIILDIPHKVVQQ